MAPSEHLDWFDDNVAWFASLPASEYPIDVPACPGWDVERVITHLTIGLGFGYLLALSAAPTATEQEVWADVSWPTAASEPTTVRSAFVRHMQACSTAFRSTDPLLRCWTYAGPGAAQFWFRRAAIETTLHRMDVSEALPHRGASLRVDRAHDAIVETVEFALPLAASIVGRHAAAIEIDVDGFETPLVLGAGVPLCRLAGSPESVLATLWGRSRADVETHGDTEAAASWMSLIEAAFAGR